LPFVTTKGTEKQMTALYSTKGQTNAMAAYGAIPVAGRPAAGRGASLRSVAVVAVAVVAAAALLLIATQTVCPSPNPALRRTARRPMGEGEDPSLCRMFSGGPRTSWRAAAPAAAGAAVSGPRWPAVLAGCRTHPASCPSALSPRGRELRRRCGEGMCSHFPRARAVSVAADTAVDPRQRRQGRRLGRAGQRYPGGAWRCPPHPVRRCLLVLVPASRWRRKPWRACINNFP